MGSCVLTSTRHERAPVGVVIGDPERHRLGGHLARWWAITLGDGAKGCQMLLRRQQPVAPVPCRRQFIPADGSQLKALV